MKILAAAFFVLGIFLAAVFLISGDTSTSRNTESLSGTEADAFTSADSGVKFSPEATDSLADPVAESAKVQETSAASVDSNDPYTNSFRLIDLLVNGGTEAHIKAMLAYVRTLPNSKFNEKIFTYASDALRTILKDNPERVWWARDRFMEEKSDNAQKVLLTSLIWLSGIHRDPGNETAFEYDMLTAYSKAGPRTRMSISSFLPHFRNYGAVDSLIQDAISHGHVSEALKAMESTVYIEEWYQKSRERGEDRHPEVELRQSLSDYVDLIVELGATENTEDVRDALETLTRLQPSSLPRIQAMLKRDKFTSEFLEWVEAYVHQNQGQLPWRPPSTF